MVYVLVVTCCFLLFVLFICNFVMVVSYLLAVGLGVGCLLVSGVCLRVVFVLFC